MREHRENSVSSERPITTLAEDELGRTGFAEAVSKIIGQWGGRDSLVIAIYGPWGSGKSSLKNMVLDALPKGDSKTIPMEFNPWEWAGQEKVFEGFFGELSAKLGSADASTDASKLAKKVRMYGAMLSAAASITGVIRWSLVGFLAVIAFFGFAPLLGTPRILLATFGGLAIAAVLVLTLLGRTADKIATYLAAKAEATTKSVAEVKKELQALLKDLPKNVLVVVDDIDRLTPSGIRMMFQLVKANADFPNLVYLLLLQRDIVERALSGGSGPEEGNGAEFLKKVVQVAFDIPRLSPAKLEEALESTVRRIVDSTRAEGKFQSQRWGKLFVSGIRPYFRTLRDVRRFGNTLLFHFELYRNGETFDANPVDLIALEVLRQFEPAVYQRLHVSKELLTGTSHSLLGDWQGSDKKEVAEALLNNSIRPVEARTILVGVFPPFAWATTTTSDKARYSSTHRGTFEKEWLRDLRACHPDAFDRYFGFSLSEDDISESEMSSLLEATRDRHRFVEKLTQLKEKRLLGAAVIRLGALNSSISVENTVPFGTGLFDMERQLLYETRPDKQLIQVPIATQAVLLVRALLQRHPIEARGRLLHEVIAQTTALFLPIISFESTEEDRKQALDPIVSSGEEAHSLKELCVRKIRAAKSVPEFLSHPSIQPILKIWSQWASLEEVSAWLATNLASDPALFSLLAAFVQPMNDVDDGRIVRVRYRFLLEDFARYLNPDDLVERIRQLNSTNENDKAVRSLFLVAFNRWKSSGKLPYAQDLDAWDTIEDLSVEADQISHERGAKKRR
jgi:predicted KAP-like P-loop ATPase